MDLIDWWNMVFPGMMAILAMAEILARLRFLRTAGKVELRLGTTRYNHIVLGIYLGWMITARPFLSSQALTLALCVAVTLLVVCGGLTRLQFREGGMANGFWRISWPAVKRAEWQKDKLIVRGNRHPLHPDRFVWRIPASGRAEVDGLLRRHLPPEVYPEAPR